jgi:outer membrane protein
MLSVLLVSMSALGATSTTAQSMTLAEAFHFALGISDPVKLAEQAIRDAQIRTNDVWTELGATANAFGTAAIQQKIGGGVDPNMPGAPVPTIQPQTLLRVKGSIVQPIYRQDFFAERRAALEGLAAAEAVAARAKEQLTENVVTAFIGVLRTRQIEGIAKGAVLRADAALQFAKARVKAGGALKTAEILASLDLRSQRIALVAAERDRRLAEASIQLLIGIEPPKVLILPALPRAPLLDEGLDRVKTRSDVRALAKKTLDAISHETAGWQHLGWWPHLDVQGDALYQDFKIANLTNTNWDVIGILTIPLFQTGGEITEAQRRESATRTAELNESLLRKTAVDDVRHTAARVDTANRALLLAEEQIEEARQHYNLVLSQFKLGAVTFLEVTNAQLVLSQAENGQVVAIYDRQQAVYDYLFAIGILEI